MSEEEANKLKRMYLLQEEKIELLESIIKEQERTISVFKTIYKNLSVHTTPKHYVKSFTPSGLT